MSVLIRIVSKTLNTVNFRSIFYQFCMNMNSLSWLLISDRFFIEQMLNIVTLHVHNHV